MPQLNVPTSPVLYTLDNCFLADPGLVSACPAVQSSFHLHAGLIRSLTLAHDQHLCHTVRHAAVELTGGLPAAVSVALPRRACVKNGHQVLVADRITDTDCQPVQAGSSTVGNCVRKCIG